MTLFVRAITSLCYAALLLGSLYLNTHFFTLVVFAMATLSVLEIQRMTKHKLHLAFIFFPTILLVLHYVEQTTLPLLVLGVVGTLLLTYYYKRKQKTPFSKTFATVLGFFSVSIPLILLVVLGNQNPDYVAFFFGIIWLNDSSAYLVGSSVGKRALAPTISPNKTIEGSIGGIVVSTSIMLYLGTYFDLLDANTILLTAVVTASCGGLGDLVQSKLKRQCGVKDSGNILPGHGGIYDRLDSSLFSIPLYFLILFVFEYVS